MDFLATSTILGTLETFEIYVQYNGPRLLACKNQASQIFLALWVDEEEDSDLWLYMLVSLDKLKFIRTGQICLYQAFSKPESHFLYEVNYTHADSQWTTKKVAAEELDQDCLPLKDTFLSCESTILPQLESQTVAQNAITKMREVVNLVLEPISNYPNEISVSGLGKVLSTFQPLINQLVNPTPGSTSRDTLKNLEFNVFATSPGSFQVELASSVFEPDMFGNSTAGDAIEKLFDLIKIRLDADELQNFMLSANKKTPKQYCHFLESLINSGTGLRIDWGSPTLNRGGSIKASLSSIHEALELIKKIDSLEIRTIKIVGELFKVDKDSWKFGIRETGEDLPYKGSILPEARNDAGTATISKLYTAIIYDIPEINTTTNDIRNHYKLAALQAYHPPGEQLNLKPLI
jgi:hypothetical protein